MALVDTFSTDLHAPASLGQTTLTDGTRIGFRLARPEDRDALIEGYAKLSQRSRYLRFFTASERLSSALIQSLTAVDTTDRVAVIAHLQDDHESPIGVVRWVRSEEHPTEADVALTVIDAWHGRGVAAHTWPIAADWARRQGIDTFTATVLAENRRMRTFFTRRGGKATRDPGDASVLTVRVPLTD